MRGRDWFRIGRPILVGAGRALGLLPRGVAALLLELLRPIPTRLGVALRYIVVSRLLLSCGDNLAVFDGCYLRNLGRARIGSNVSIHPLCYIDAIGGLTIGSDVSIAHGTSIMTFEHDFSRGDVPTRDLPLVAAPVTIGNDTWIGAGCRILAGVTVGEHVVLGAGSVVTRDIPSHSLAVGAPARVIKRIKTAALAATPAV